VAGLPHDGLPAVPGDVVHQHLRALDVEDDLGARVAGEEIPGEEGQQQVRLVAPPLLVHDADPVGVAVVGHAHVRADLERPGHQVPHVLLHLRIGEMVGEGAVGLAEELDDLAAQTAQQLGGENPRDPVARVHHHLQRSPQGHPGGDRVPVLLARVAGRARAHAPLVVAGPDGGEQPLDLALGQRGRPRVHHLDPVVRDRIVAAGDGGAAVELPVRGREVEQGRVVHPDVHHVEPGREHPGRECLLERPRRRPVVHPEGDRVPPAPLHQGAVGPPHQLEHRRGDVDAHLAAHVVGAEDVGIELGHRRLVLGMAAPVR